MIPMALYLMVFATPLVTLYHIGAFTADAIGQIASYLAVMAVALPFYGVNAYLNKIFSSIRRMGVFSVINFAAVAAQVAVTLPDGFNVGRVLLHFGAVDWKADVFVNDILAGSHTGGFTPFSLDITPYLNAKGEQKLVVRVFDGTDKGYQPRGKQVLNPNGIWYTPVSGIWQTVWIEPVAKSHISGIKAIPNLDQKNIAVTVAAENCTTGDLVEVKILDKGKLVASATGLPGSPLRLCIAEPKLWSPDSPFLYDMEVSLRQGGKTVDKVDSYTAMRKIGTKRDKGGILRMTLNDKPLFHFGPLDQGWWPDGLFTAPTDEALLF